MSMSMGSTCMGIEVLTGFGAFSPALAVSLASASFPRKRESLILSAPKWDSRFRGNDAVFATGECVHVR